MDAYWRAANYLSVGRSICLYDNPLLEAAADAGRRKAHASGALGPTAKRQERPSLKQAANASVRPEAEVSDAPASRPGAPGAPRRHCPHPPSADGLRTAPSLTARMPPGVPRASPFHSLESPGSTPAAFACAIALATVANVGAPSCIDSTAVDGTMTIVALLRLRPSYSMFIARR
jgi:hypothetical protein